jgi:hypothetical protein
MIVISFVCRTRLSAEISFRRESKTTEDFRRFYFILRVEPQQAFGAALPLAPSLRPFCISVQQPSLASVTPLADFSAQQASFVVQQPAFFSTTFAEQQPATFATAFVGPQHAFASLQQAKPSVQHF